MPKAGTEQARDADEDKDPRPDPVGGEQDGQSDHEYGGDQPMAWGGKFKFIHGVGKFTAIASFTIGIDSTTDLPKATQRRKAGKATVFQP